MKPRLRLYVLLSAVAWPLLANAAPGDAPPVCLFENAGYRGRVFCAVCAYDTVPPELARRFSSVRLPQGYKHVELFEGPRFGGARLVLRQSVADLGTYDGGAWNERVSSFRGSWPHLRGCYYGVEGVK